MYPDILGKTSFFVINESGEKVLRDFKKENDLGFSVLKYYSRDEYDDFNYMFYENFEYFNDYDSNGSDYERYGCKIEQGDVVVDIGANVGMFSRWAKLRGAERVISFEPMSKTFSCLLDNIGNDSECHKIAIGNGMGTLDMHILDNEGNLGGGTSMEIKGRNIVRSERVLQLSIGNLFEIGLVPDTIDFLKIDCEGSEKYIIENISDSDLGRIRKISMEYHQGELGEPLRKRFTDRLAGLGFTHFTLFHGDGSLIQLHFWKD